MKLRTIGKIAATTFLLLLCAGVVVYFYLRLSAVDQRKDFNLFTLVPSSTVALFVTDDAHELITDIDGLTSSQNGQFLYTSKIFSALKTYCKSSHEQLTHGLKGHGRILISFHGPHCARNQALYCRLGEGDYEHLDAYFHKQLASDYPFKTFEYKNEKIRIYSVANGDFLSCYLTRDFIVVSYQKKLIEEVIDARKSGVSLANDSSFAETSGARKSLSAATLYTRMNDLIGWTEFDIKLKGDCIYITGVTDQQTGGKARPWVYTWCKQTPVKGLGGEWVPLTTYYYTCQGMSNLQSILSAVKAGETGKSAVEEDDEIGQRDDKLAYFLMQHVRKKMFFTLFHGGDSLTERSAVMGFDMRDAYEASRELRNLVRTLHWIPGEPVGPRFSFISSTHNSYFVYHLPATRIFAQLAGVEAPPVPMYAAFCGDMLLWAPNRRYLLHYIRHMEWNSRLVQNPFYQSATEGLTETYNFLMMADFEQVVQRRPMDGNLRFLPDFFAQHEDFFRYYTGFVQLTTVDGVICPNIILKYKHKYKKKGHQAVAADDRIQ